jgi:flagellar motor switch protein FliN
MQTIVNGFIDKTKEGGIRTRNGALPDNVSEDISVARPVALPEISTAAEERNTGASPRSRPWQPLANTAHPIHQVKATVEVYVGSVSVSVGELLAATENQVLILDRKVGQPVDLLLEGQVIARGQLVAVNDRFAVRITELPQPLTMRLEPNPANKV